MARPIVWTAPAADDLEAAVEFIARDSEAYACTLAQLVVETAQSLARFPHRGHRLRDPKLSRFRESGCLARKCRKRSPPRARTKPDNDALRWLMCWSAAAHRC